MNRERILVSEREIVIQGNTFVRFVGLATFPMSFMGIKFFCDTQDMVGRILIAVWIAALWMMGAWALVQSSKELVLNDEGVLCRSWISVDFLPWGELEDYGLSYYGRTNKRWNTYHLYFSRTKLSIKNECSKRLRGKMIKVDIVGKEYSAAVRTILPFCKQRTSAPVFIGRDKIHFWR